MSKPTAVQRLQPSRLDTSRALLSEDIDLTALTLALRGKASLNVLDMVIDGTITRTIEGASTVKFTFVDRDRVIRNSGELTSTTNIKIDGLWFRLRAVTTQDDDITLTFEDREVSVLRKYPILKDKNGKTVPRAQLLRAASVAKYDLLYKHQGRAAYARGLVLEPGAAGELVIKFESPALEKISPITSSKDRLTQDEKDAKKHNGFAPGARVTVKNKPADAEQRDNLSRVLDVGLSLGARRKVLVAALMVVIQESTARTTATNGDHVGLFQQSAAAGWPATRDPETDAYAFFTAAISDDKKNPNLPLEQLGEDVQVSGHPEAYAQWKDEANADVTLWGSPQGDDLTAAGAALGDGSSNGHVYTRGRVASKGAVKVYERENNWDCLQRLADEVKWRCFCVAGVVWFISDKALFASRPVMRISEASDGVDAINVDDYDTRKKVGTITVNARVTRWQAPPGSVVELFDMGLFSGRWLVSEIERSLFDTQGTIKLVKPTTALPERQSPEWGGGQTSGTTLDIPAPPSAADPTAVQYQVGTALVQPIPDGLDGGHGGVHDTKGLADYPAIDFFGVPGTPVIAVMSGTIDRFSGHNPSLGAIDGPGGPLGWSIYLTADNGTSFYYTHLDKRTCVVGQHVQAGQKIATIADYDKYGRQSHVHLGAHGGPISITDVAAAPQAVSGLGPVGGD